MCVCILVNTHTHVYITIKLRKRGYQLEILGIYQRFMERAGRGSGRRKRREESDRILFQLKTLKIKGTKYNADW